MMVQTTESEQQTPWLWRGKRREDKKKKIFTNTLFFLNDQTNTQNKSQYQYLNNTAEQVLKMKHNREKKITYTVGTHAVLEGPFKGLI